MSPQKRPSHDGGGQGEHAPQSLQKAPPWQGPQSIESPHVFRVTPHSTPREAHVAAGEGKGSVTHTEFWQVSDSLQLPQSSMPPQPSDWGPQPLLGHCRVSHAVHCCEKRSQTIGAAHAPQSSFAPHPSTTVPHAMPAAVQLSTGHSLQAWVEMLHSFPAGHLPQSCVTPQSSVTGPHSAPGVPQTISDLSSVASGAGPESGPNESGAGVAPWHAERPRVSIARRPPTEGWKGSRVIAMTRA
jgi:hypothetical protein